MVSEFIQGVPLRDFLEHRTKEPDRYSFDMASLQKLFIFCMLANFEDCRLENCLVRKKTNGLYEVVLIDTERGLGREFVKPKEGQDDGTRVHCVLFCFLEMLLQPVDVRLRGIDDERARVELLALQNEHLYQLALRQHLHEEKESEKIILGIHLGEEFSEDLNEKWRKIKALLSMKKSLAEIFLYVMPDIASKYLSRTDLTLDILRQCELVDPGRNKKDASTPPSAYCPLDRYICWNSKGTRNMKFILAENPDLTFEQVNGQWFYDYSDSKNTHDDLLLSLRLILPPSPIVKSKEEEKYHAEDQEIEQFLREQEEEEEVS